MRPILCLLSLAVLVFVEQGSCAARGFAVDDEPVYVVADQRARREAEDDFVEQNDDQRDRREAEAKDAELAPEVERFRRAITKALEDSFDQLNVGQPEIRQRRFWHSVLHGVVQGVGAFANHLGGGGGEAAEGGEAEGGAAEGQ